jgi:hypothetical protein
MQNNLFTEEQLANNPLRNQKRFLSIPMDILIFSLERKKVNQVKLFIALKVLFNGRFLKDDNETIQLICHTLGYKTPKTFYKNFRWLISHKWVTFNKEYCIIKSSAKLRFKRQLYTQKGVEFESVVDIKTFRPFVYGAVYTYAMKYKRASDRYSGIDKGSPNSKKYHRRSSSYELPVNYLAKILNISKSTASTYKKVAAKSGYLVVKKNYTYLGIRIEDLNKYKRFSGDPQIHKLRVIKGELYIQESDKIWSDMLVKRKRNLRKVN